MDDLLLCLMLFKHTNGLHILQIYQIVYSISFQKHKHDRKWCFIKIYS